MVVKPLNPSNAIESVSFGLEWQPPLPAHLMPVLADLHQGELARQLPAKRYLAPAGPGMGGGWLFAHVAPDGEPSLSLLLTPTLLSVTSREYSRWSALYARAQGLIAPCLPLLAAEVEGIAAVGLQYVDVFWGEGEASDFPTEEVLRRGSPLLPEGIFARRDLWHVHQGYFAPLPAPAMGRRLTTVNLDLVAKERRLELRVGSSHRTLFAAPMALSAAPSLPASPASAEGGDAQPDAAMVAMHDENKAVLRTLLQDQLCAAIGLGD